MESTVTLIIPMYLAAVLALSGILYSRRHQGTDRGRKVLIVLLVAAMVLSVGTAVVQLSVMALSGHPGVIVPIVLFVPLAAVLIASVVSNLRPRPVTTAQQTAAGRRLSDMWTLAGFLIISLLAYGAGYFAGFMIALVQPAWSGLSLPLGVAAVVAVFGSLIPWILLKYRAARRRRAVAAGHPSSPEVVDHAMKAATAAQLNADIRGLGSPRQSLFFLVGLVLVLLTVPIAKSIWSLAGQLPGAASGPAAIDFATLQAWAIVVALVLGVGALITYLAPPMTAAARAEYLLSALSDQQRLQWEADSLTGNRRPHRFPSRLADPDRSIRVLTVIVGTGIRLEQIPAGSLMREDSAPLLLDDEDLEDEADELDDPADDDPSLVHVIETLIADGREFDVFEMRHPLGVHVVAVGTDDYEDFPEDIATQLTAL